MTDFNSLMIFAAVVKAKSFSEAARRLKMPLASVSRRVADLEAELGVRLLERSTRSLRLTEVGSTTSTVCGRGKLTRHPLRCSHDSRRVSGPGARSRPRCA